LRELAGGPTITREDKAMSNVSAIPNSQFLGRIDMDSYFFSILKRFLSRSARAEMESGPNSQELGNGNGPSSEVGKATPGIGNQEAGCGVTVQESGNGKAGEQGASGSIQKPTLGQAALYGLPGRIVTTVDTYTEADPAAILVNILVMFGNVIGRKPYFKVEESKHYTNLYAALVGPSSSARKGQSLSTPKRLFSAVDSKWVTNQIVSGLSSGEGLIHKIRDPNPNAVPADPGASDKRLQVIEQEFAQALKVMKREGNILSPILRQAWDGSPLQPLTKNSQTYCNEPHISIIGHITPEELRRQLNEVEIANGFANRFMWFYVERSKLIDDPTGTPENLLQPLIADLKTAVQFARSVQAMTRDPQAAELWKQVYPRLTEDRDGLFGVITQRAAPQVLRLSMIYALMDQSAIIAKTHLEAALALWKHSEHSVKLIFEDMTGDANVDLVVKCGKAFKKITRTQMWSLISRNNKKDELDRIVKVIQDRGLASLDAAGTLSFE
jgi:hypothetical protein